MIVFPITGRYCKNFKKIGSDVYINTYIIGHYDTTLQSGLWT